MIHACGGDTHITAMVAAAAAGGGEGPVEGHHIVIQSAGERVGGAKAMLVDVL